MVVYEVYELKHTDRYGNIIRWDNCQNEELLMKEFKNEIDSMNTLDIITVKRAID